jgi:hypothetical protein
MATPAHDDNPTPACRALDALAANAGDTTALDDLASSEIVVPVPDDAVDAATADPSVLALPVLERPGGAAVVPVFTSVTAMAELLPFVSRYRLVPLGALASQWPDGDLSLAIDDSTPHGLTLTPESVRTLLARRAG